MLQAKCSLSRSVDRARAPRAGDGRACKPWSVSGFRELSAEHEARAWLLGRGKLCRGSREGGWLVLGSEGQHVGG